jgi:hypothetical protein
MTSCNANIGVGEVASLEQQFVPGRDREGAGEAVANIEPCPMAALAKLPQCIDRNLGLLWRDDPPACLSG